MKSASLAGLWPMSVSFPITLTQGNMQVSQVIMNALSDTWPFSLPPACLVCSLCCILSPSSPFYTAEFPTVSSIFAFSVFLSISYTMFSNEQFKGVSGQFVRQRRCHVFHLFHHYLNTDLRPMSIQFRT